MAIGIRHLLLLAFGAAVLGASLLALAGLFSQGESPTAGAGIAKESARLRPASARPVSDEGRPTGLGADDGDVDAQQKESSDGAEQTRAGWKRCLEHREAKAGLAPCLAEVVPSMRADEIGRAMCSVDLDFAKALLLEALRGLPPNEWPLFLVEVRQSCSSYKNTPLLHMVLAGLEPDLVKAFRGSLAPQLLFDGSSDEVLIEVASWFIRQGDEEMRLWVEDGARGLWGGSNRQLVRACAVASANLKGAEAKLAFAASVISSNAIPDGTSLGSLVADTLTHDYAWPDGDPCPALIYMQALLDDQRFAHNAAGVLVDAVPPRFRVGDPAAALWDDVQSEARRIVGKAR